MHVIKTCTEDQVVNDKTTFAGKLMKFNICLLLKTDKLYFSMCLS